MLFQNPLSKNFLHAIAVLSYLPKLKGSYGRAFGVYFRRNFSLKGFLFNIQFTKFQCHTFFLSQDIKQNVLLCSYLDN